MTSTACASCTAFLHLLQPAAPASGHSGGVRCAQFIVLFTLVAGVVAAIRARMWNTCRNCKACHGFGIERWGARQSKCLLMITATRVCMGQKLCL